MFRVSIHKQIKMATLPILQDHELGSEAATLFDEIRTARDTDYVNHFWRVLANQPAKARSTWEQLKVVMAPGALDPLTKEMIYIAVSAANNCDYCVHSHTASAKLRGMTPEMYAELIEVITMASQTNAMANSMQVPVDDCFLVERADG